jgi:hypothetical protein
MASSIINYIVEKYLNKILEIDEEKTKTSLTSGIVEMENIKIKPDIFKTMNIPYFELVNGYVGKIKVEFSVLTIYKNPIKVYIDNVFFHARQKEFSKISDEDEIKGWEQSKQEKLSSYEELKQQVQEMSSSEPGFVQKLINNIQIEIGNILVRFDDDISYPESPFVFGLVLKKLLIRTTTNKYELSKENIPPADVNYKILQLQGLNIFLDYMRDTKEIGYEAKILPEEFHKAENLRSFLKEGFKFYTYCMSELNTYINDEEAHRYLLYDLTIELKVAINETPKENLKPQIAAGLNINKLRLKTETPQIKVVLKLLNYIKLSTLAKDVIYKNYYVKELTLEEKTDYMQKYLTYYRTKYNKKLKDEKEAEKIKNSFLKSFEEGLTFDQIQSMRQAALLRYDYEMKLSNIDTEIQAINNKWAITSFFSGNSDKAKLTELASMKDQLQKQEMELDRKIQEHLQLEKAKSLEEFKDFPQDYVRFDIDFSLEECVIVLSEGLSRKLLGIHIIGFSTEALIGLNFQTIYLNLVDFYINQYVFDNPLFNKIIESYQDDPDVNIKTDGYSVVNKKGALFIAFENNPNLPRSDLKLTLVNEKRMFVNVNLYALQYAIARITEAIQGDLDFSEIAARYKGKVNEYILQGIGDVDKFTSGNYQHFNIELDIWFKGPKIIIPQNIHDNNNTNCFIMSLGSLEMGSTLAPRKDVTKDYTKLTNFNEIYDLYEIKFAGLEFSTISDFSGIKTLNNSKTKLNLIDDINIEIKIGNLIEPKNLLNENIRLEINLPGIKMNIRDVQVEFIVHFLHSLRIMTENLNKELRRGMPLREKKKHRFEAEKGIPEPGANMLENQQDEQQKAIELNKHKKPTKAFMKFYFNLKKVEVNVLKSLSQEEITLLKRDNSFTSEKEYKNFLNFVTNNFSMAVIIQDNQDIDVNLKLLNMFLFDSDFDYKLTETGKTEQKTCLNPEFQCILGSINEELHNEGAVNSRRQSFISEAYSSQNTSKSFIEFQFNYYAVKHKTDIKIGFTKLLVSFNLSTMNRLFSFSRYYTELMAILEEEFHFDNTGVEISENIEHLKEIRQGYTKQGLAKNNIFRKVVNKLDYRKNLDNRSQLTGDEIQFKQSAMSRTKHSSVYDNTTISKKEHSKLNFSFEMKEIELNYPFDAQAENTKVLKFNLNMLIKLKQAMEYEGIYIKRTNQLVRQNYTRKNLHMNLMVFNVDFDILTFNNNQFLQNLQANKMLSNSRITMSVRTFLLLEKETNVTSVDFHIEPIIMTMGFRQVKIIQHYLNELQKFNTEMAEYNKRIKESREELVKGRIQKKISNIHKKIDNESKYNISLFNNLLDVNFKLDKTVIKLIDNTSFHEKPLTKIELSKVVFKIITNSDPVDSENMAQAIVEMISRKEISNYNIYNLYQYINGTFNIEICNYNEKVSNWEPILEPWNGKLSLSQVNKVTRLKMEFESDVMLNLNISFYSMQVFNNIMKRLAEKEEDWINEDQIVKHDVIDNDVCLEIVNLTGIDIVFKFDADEREHQLNKISPLKTFTKNEINDIYKNLKDNETSLLRKDKLTLKILECMPIENIDFSFNHYCVYRLMNFNRNVNNTFNFFEIIVKVQNVGLIKTINIESNMMIHNNTTYPIQINAIKTEQFLERYNREGTEAINLRESEFEVIEPQKFIKVPLAWLIENYMIFGSIKIDENRKICKLFYEELNSLYKIKGQLQEGEEVSDETLINQYSKVINYDMEDRKLDVVLDLLVLKPNIQERFILYTYAIVINPPIVLDNKIPYTIGLRNSASNEDSTLLPLQSLPLYYLNYIESHSNLSLKLHYLRGKVFQSGAFSLNTDIGSNLEDINKKVIRVHNIANEADIYDINLQYDVLPTNDIYNLNYLRLEKNLAKSKRIYLYVDFLVVNKMDSMIYVQPSSVKDVKEDHCNNAIFEKSVCLFNLPNNDTKASFKTANSQWSNHIEITTHGLDGVISLTDKVNKDYFQDLAIIITSSSYFNNSTLIIIEPRYLLINKLGFEVFYRQMFNTVISDIEIKKVLDNDPQNLVLKKHKDKLDLKYLQFIARGYDSSEMDLNEYWSQTVNIDALDEFNIQLPLHKFYNKSLINENNTFTYDGINRYLLVKVTIHSADNGLIYVILSLPEFPQFVFKNFTEETITVRHGPNIKDIVKILPNTTVPYCFPDIISGNKDVLIRIADREINFSFDKLEKIKEIELGENKLAYCSINTDNQNKTRVLKIQTTNEKDDDVLVKQLFIKSKMSKRTKIHLNLKKGIGLSIIDDIPKEVFYISIYDIKILYENNNQKFPNKIELIENIELYIKNFQIDYCLEDSFNLVLFPKQQQIPSTEEELIKEGVEIVPFFSFLITRKTTHNIRADYKTTKIVQIDFILQEMNLQIDQAVLNTLLSLANSINNVVDFYKASSKKAVARNSLEGEILPSDYDPMLNCEIQSVDQIIAANNQNDNVIFIQALMLGALKVNLTLRIDITTLQLTLVPGFVVKILGTVGNALARITKSPLKFSELIINNCYTNIGKLSAILQKHYIRQGVIQIYKILGSSDLIGNPIGLVDKLGTGVVEFFNEPRKGFLMGPKEFGKGIAKGLNSLVSNVVGGGFDTVSKITGTLLTATK